MPLLTFSVDADVNLEQANIIESDLHRQISGLYLDIEASGNLFEIRNPCLPSGRVIVRLESVPESGISVDSRTRLEMVSPNHNSHKASSTPVPVAFAPDHVISEVTQEIGSYVSTISVNSPDNLRALDHAESRLRGLIGLPKDEIIADLVGRLRGIEWLAEWSRRHYGDVIAGTAIVHRSTPFILLAGDPGTGKSALAHDISPVIARKLGSPVLFVELNARLRGAGIQGRAATEVVNVFDAISNIAEKNSLPTLVFLDEAEAVAGSRGSGDDSSGAQENVAVVDALIVALDRVFTRSDTKMVFLTATNLSNRIDAAVWRRATIYRFKRPSSEDRRLMLQNTLAGSVSSVTLDNVNQALERHGLALTAADVLNQVVGRAIREAAHDDRPIEPARLLKLAEGAIATSPIETP